MVPPVAQLPWVFRLPCLSSVSEVRTTGSEDTEVFFTSTVKVTGPPGSLTEVGEAVLVTVMDGATSFTVTVASSEPVAGVFSSSLTVAVAVSVSEYPALPDTVAGDEQEEEGEGGVV